MGHKQKSEVCRRKQIPKTTACCSVLLPIIILLTACGVFEYGGSSSGGGGANGTGPIGDNGGTVTSSDGNASVTIPPLVLPQETTITVAVVSNPPSGNVGTAYKFGPSDTILDTSINPGVTISITFDKATLPSGTNEVNLRLGALVNNQWEWVVGSVVYTDVHMVRGTTTSLGIYGVIIPSYAVPSAPTAVSATPGDGQVTISWNPAAGAKSYNVYMAWVTGVNKANYLSLLGGMQHTGVSSPFTHTNLNNGITYYFVVTAVNDFGESSESSQVSATPTGGSTLSLGIFKATGRMKSARSYHTATLLPNGKVLIAGGLTRTATDVQELATAELYDPVRETFTVTGSMSTARSGHSATLLRSGNVLIVGNDQNPDLYVPTTGTFITTGKRNFGSGLATHLSDGKVLLTQSSKAELYDPDTGTFLLLQNMATGHTAATLLAGGKVLMSGGFGQIGAELYDPATFMFSNTGNLITRRSDQSASLLRNGKVLIAGGQIPGGPVIASAELYDPAMGTFIPTNNMIVARQNHLATVLANGMVLITGGDGLGTLQLASAELYDPSKGTFVENGSMIEGRTGHTAILLLNGKVLVTGGIGNRFNAMESAELFQ